MSVDRKGAESAQPLLFNKDKVQIWLKYPTGATRTFQRTRDFMLPVGDSSEKKKKKDYYLQMVTWHRLE